jgi:hypothetical protein
VRRVPTSAIKRLRLNICFFIVGLISDENERDEMLRFLHIKFTLLVETQREKLREEEEEAKQRRFFQEQFKLNAKEELVTCNS